MDWSPRTVTSHVQVLAAHRVVLGVLESLGDSCGIALYQGVILLSLVADVPSSKYQFPTFITAGGHYLDISSQELQDPTHPLLAVVRTEASDKLHVKGGGPISDQLRDLVLAPPERALQVVVPLEGCGLAQLVTEWSHVFCLNEVVGNLIDETEPTANLANVGRRGDLEPREVYRLLGKLKLFRGEDHSILVAVG